MHARPQSLEHALELLRTSSWSILAGGTDFFPGLRDQSPVEPVLDITSIAGLEQIDFQVQGDRPVIRIGALATWSDLVATELPPAFAALKAAALEVGSVQIQNRATIAGNLCNASPAADGVPPLLCLEAEIELTSCRGVRTIPLAEFIQGNRKIQRNADELVTAIIVPQNACDGHSAFTKLGARRYLVISISMVAANVELDSSLSISRASIAVGSCSEVARRLPALEQLLSGSAAGHFAVDRADENDTATLQAAGTLQDSALQDSVLKDSAAQDGIRSQIEAAVYAELKPIDDIRATGSYRKQATQELIYRTLCTAVENALQAKPR